MVAGVGGVVALVVAYLRQRDLEQGRFVERFGAAAAQLGPTDVAVRSPFVRDGRRRRRIPGAWFVDVTFSPDAVFKNVDFGTQSISFADPKRGAPEPVFDWSADITLKPADVEPEDWPSAVVTSVPSS
ncbi:hypothetical protein [Nocardia miyunensis]|uniref:hypothetical protein n=1 Tax=Nocardia miyunensis TaxID=282684 RepID=UPI00082BDAB1|nr:hypothetical protein [Nocardia miyunensis]